MSKSCSVLLSILLVNALAPSPRIAHANEAAAEESADRPVSSPLAGHMPGRPSGTAAAQITLKPKATGTIAHFMELKLFQMPVGTDLQSVYFKTTTLNREFRRGFIEFELPKMAGPIQQAQLILTESRGWTSFPKPAVAHEVSFYRADLKITNDDYTRLAGPPLFIFETDENEPTKVITGDVTRALREIPEGNIGFRIKLRVDPEFNEEDSFGTGFQSIYSGAPPRLVVRTGGSAAATITMMSPPDGAVFAAPAVIPIQAVAVDPLGYIHRVEFFANERLIGVSEITFIRAPDPGEPIHHSLEWKVTEAGAYSLMAAGKDRAGNEIKSAPVRVTVTAMHDAPSDAVRVLPLAYVPSIPFTVEVKVTPRRGVHAYGIEDQPPVGWRVEPDISHNGVFDRATLKVKFGPFFDDRERILRYAVTAPADARGVGIFKGMAGFDGEVQAIAGASRLAAGIRHPADIDPADNRISLKEVTAYGLAWRTGKHWIRDPNPIPMSYVTRSGTLWRGGETYLFDPSAGNAPRWWLNTSAAGRRSLDLVRNSAPPVSRAIRTEFIGGTGSVRRSIQLTPNPPVLSYAVEERASGAVEVVSVTEGGIYDPANAVIRWGPFLDGTPRTLGYELAATAEGVEAMPPVGTASFDGVDLRIEPSTGMDPAVHGPSIHGIRKLENGGLELICSGPAGQEQIVEVSSDLLEWRELASMVPANSTFRATDASAGGHSARFYRVRIARAVHSNAR